MLVLGGRLNRSEEHVDMQVEQLFVETLIDVDKKLS